MHGAEPEAGAEHAGRKQPPPAGHPGAAHHAGTAGQGGPASPPGGVLAQQRRRPFQSCRGPQHLLSRPPADPPGHPHRSGASGDRGAGTRRARPPGSGPFPLDPAGREPRHFAGTPRAGPVPIGHGGDVAPGPQGPRRTPVDGPGGAPGLRSPLQLLRGPHRPHPRGHGGTQRLRHPGLQPDRGHDGGPGPSRGLVAVPGTERRRLRPCLRSGQLPASRELLPGPDRPRLRLPRHPSTRSRIPTSSGCPPPSGAWRICRKAWCW